MNYTSTVYYFDANSRWQIEQNWNIISFWIMMMFPRILHMISTRPLGLAHESWNSPIFEILVRIR